jgi:TPR repeat protein
MAEVRRALSEARYFDAFSELQDLAADGNPEAQFELAGFHHYGRIGPVSFEKALDWYTRAANQGSSDAMIGLAVLYGHGQGVAKNPQTAYQWLMTASLASPPPANMDVISGAMADLRSELTAEQIAEAEATAHRFVAKPE